MDHHRRFSDTSVILPGDWTARGLLGGLLKEWDDVTILQLLFFAGTVADRSEWLCSLHCKLHFVSGSTPTHDSPHNNIGCNRNPLLFFFKSSLFMMQYFAIFLLKKTLKKIFFDACSLSGRNWDWRPRQRMVRQEMTPQWEGHSQGLYFSLPHTHAQR